MLGHPRSPYHRVDALASSRHVRVELAGETLAESTRPMALFETDEPTRFYFAQADVRRDLLEPSETVTTSPYLGSAVWFSARIAGELHRGRRLDVPLPDPAAAAHRGPARVPGRSRARGLMDSAHPRATSAARARMGIAAIALVAVLVCAGCRGSGGSHATSGRTHVDPRSLTLLPADLPGPYSIEDTGSGGGNEGMPADLVAAYRAAGAFPWFYGATYRPLARGREPSSVRSAVDRAAERRGCNARLRPSGVARALLLRQRPRDADGAGLYRRRRACVRDRRPRRERPDRPCASRRMARGERDRRRRRRRRERGGRG